MRKAPRSRWLPGVSRGALATLLLAAPASAFAAGFAATTTLPSGVTSANNGNTQTITLSPTAAVTTLTWTPTNAPVNGTINFLPAGNTEAFVGTPSQVAAVTYTVLNRIISGDATNVMGFYGAVTSTANTRLWFYSPGGLLIASTASFNVGGLVLTTAAPTLDANNSFITSANGTDSFSLASPAGSTSAITIQPGATINAVTGAHSNYIVAIAPQINQGGAISVSGSAALVAAESATFAVDSHGLFNITVSSGTTVATNTFINTGAVGGPNADASGSYQRVYMVAVPKNNAISMAISAGGGIGFAVADAANLDGDTIVLSAGSNIADSGSGNPVVAGRAGSGTASLTVGGGDYTSNTYAVSTDSATVSDPALSIAFASGLTVVAPTATVNAQIGTISVGGNLAVDADNNLTGVGGTALLQADGGSIMVTGNALVSAAGSWQGGTQNPGNQITTGGIAQVAVTGDQMTVGGTLTVDASADATGANAALASTASPYYDSGAYAQGGSASLTVSGASASLLAMGGITVGASALSSFDQYGDGGTAQGGTALIEAASGGAISVGQNGAIAAAANASAGVPPTQQEGDYTGSGYSMGGTAQVIANAGTISVAGVDGITALANATGGSASGNYSGTGGSATGGTALIAVEGASGSITTNTSGSIVQSDFSTEVEANATGGYASGSQYGGGNATGGSATLRVYDAGEAITIDHGNAVDISAQAVGGTGAGPDGGGGTATGGTAQLLANGGSIAITNASLSINARGVGGNENDGYGGAGTGGTVQLQAGGGATVTTGIATILDASADGGSTFAGAGGNATGGTIQLTANSGGTVILDASPYFNASAAGGNGCSSGGTALGGNIFISLGDNGINFDTASGVPQLNASFAAGTNASGAPATASSAGGVLLTDQGTLTLGGALTLDSNTSLYVQADGSINVSGSITSTGAGAYLHLWADYLASGTGTVTLANGALNLPGNDIDIYYNPTSLGTPTDFSAGVTAGTVTAYQLVDNIDQLQLVGSYLSQNFALGTNIAAGATQVWNGGAGFVPIGSSATPFTGNFDGLNHTITSLYIDDPLTSGVGLFGEVGNGTNITIRNVGLLTEQVTGASETGGLVGVAASVSIDNAYTTGGSVSGSSGVGGLVGVSNGLAGMSTVLFDNVHSDSSVSGQSMVGGLIGEAESSVVTHAFATGSVMGGTTDIGGLIGLNAGSVSQAYATGTVTSSSSSNNIGGLIGSNSGTVSQAYSTGNVNAGTGSAEVGGLIGDASTGTIDESWSSSPVSAPSSTNVGGFVGLNAGTITNSYWDTYSTGQTASFGSNTGTITNLNPVTSDPDADGAYAFYPNSYPNLPAADWVYDNESTRPVGAWETPVAFFGVAPIDSAHQVQLIDLNLNGSYTITQNIDMRGTASTNDIWGSAGFMPLGLIEDDPPFTGTLEGAGHVLSNLTMSPQPYYYYSIGLIQENDGIISDLGLVNVNITSTQGGLSAGAFAGVNAGLITDSFATGTINLTQSSSLYGIAGGLVGVNSGGGSDSEDGPYGTISQSYATVAITGGEAIGGLVGENEGAITGSFANGAISGATMMGGLVGESYDSTGPVITNSYWDTQLSGQTLACGSTSCTGASGATGLTTAQTLQSASFAGFSIDTSGGQSLPWRQYEGYTTPLLEAFLTPITVQPGSLTTQYDAQVQNPGYTSYGAQPSLTFGTAQLSGLTQNAGVSYVYYTGGLYSNQLGYDFVPSLNPGTLVITQAPLTLSATGVYKTYDATTNATGGDGVFVSGLYGNDSVSNLSESFTSPNVMGQNGSTLVVNNGYVINDGNGGNNYSVTLQSAEGTIVPAQLTLTAVSDSKVYDATTNSAGVVQVAGLFGEDNVTSLSQSFTSKNVMGTNGSTLVVNTGYVVNDGNGGNNYTVTLQTAPGTITPAALAITYTANPATITYGTTPSGLSGTVSDQGLQGSDTLAAVTTGTATFTTPATAQSNAGSYAINGSGLAANSNNYTFSFIQAPGNATALTINPANLTVDVLANAESRSYGTANPTLTYSETGLANGDMLTGSLATTATITSNVGVYPITQGTLSAGSNYTLNFTGANLTVTPANLTVTYTANPLTSIYGTVPSGLGGSVSAAGLVLGQTLGSVTSGAAVFSTTAGATSNVGSYAVTGSGLTANSSNYSFSFVQASGNATALTIDPATLDVVAMAQSRPYGVANPLLTYSETGLVNGDMLTGTLATSATATANVGNYAITPGSLSAGSNYTLNYTGANLTINPALLTVTYTANPATSIYGTVPSGLSGSVSATGLVLNQTLGSVTSGTAVFTTTAGATSNAGAYAISGSGLTANSSNYSFNFVQAFGNTTALTIDPATLDVIATAQSRTYGAANPALSYSETGLVNGDTLSGSLATSATATANVGNYAITQGTLSAGSNYTLSYTGANLTINPASLTVTYTANPATSIYGAAPSGLSGSVGATGLVLDQTLASVTSGTAAFTTTASATSNVGSYAVTGSGLTANSSNYTINFVQAAGNSTALTIDPATLDVIANTQSRTYGAANPALTYSETGLVNGDTLSGSLATSATATSNVGNYGITQGTLSAGSNYTLSFTGANLTIHPASLTVTYTANPASSIYGNVPTGLSGTESVSGLVNDDSLSSVTSGTASFATTATGTSNVGSYAITGSGLTGTSSNYNFTFVQAPGNATALTIAPRPITVTADPQQRAVGAANPVFTYVVTSSTSTTAPALVNGDTLTGQLTTTATADSPAGKYDILQGTLAASANYQLTYVGNILTLAYASLPLQDVIDLIETDLIDQPAANTPEQRRKQAAAELAALTLGLGLHPLQMSQNMINDQLVTTPPPVTEPVTSNGNSSLWSPGAP